MSKHLKWSVYACSLFAICATASFLYLASTSSSRGPASDSSSLSTPRWNETGASKVSPYLGGQY